MSVAFDCAAPCRFALACLGEPCRSPAADAVDAPCRVCGEPGPGWPAAALSATFADAGDLARSDSPAVCPACLHFARGDTWQAHAAERPELGIKTWAQASWRSYSHFFAPGRVLHPGPAGWAALLDNLPPPPWLAVISLTGKRNLLWRGTVATDRRAPVLLETETVWLDADWPPARGAFEAVRALGVPRDCVLSGELPWLPGRLAALREAEVGLAAWRRMRPDLMRLAHAISVRPKLAEVA